VEYHGSGGEQVGAAWDVAPGTEPDAVFDGYRREIERANAIIAGTAMDAAPAAWPEETWPDWRYPDLRSIVLHVLAETACHAGHLDIVRELIDGRTWLIVTP